MCNNSSFVSPRFYSVNKDIHIDVSNNSDGSSAQQCAFDSRHFAPSETRVYTCPCGMYGRFVRIRFPLDAKRHMQLCEVQVQAGGKDTNSIVIGYIRVYHKYTTLTVMPILPSEALLRENTKIQ